ncbi:hypothetical protein DEDE109153_13330 [Deinococcus deserti]
MNLDSVYVHTETSTWTGLTECRVVRSLQMTSCSSPMDGMTQVASAMPLPLLATLAVSVPVAAPPQELSCAALRSGVRVVVAPDVTIRLKRVGESQLQMSTGRADRTVPLDCFNEQIQATVADFNFDGVRDVAVPVAVGYMGVNIFSRLYFAGRDGTLRASRLEIGNVWPDPLTRTLTSGVKDGPFYRTESHCLSADGQDFYLCRQLEPESDATSADPTVAQWLSPAGKVLLSRRSDSSRSRGPEIWQIEPVRAYFHSRPDGASRRAAYVIRGDTVEGLEVRGSWMRVIYRPAQGAATAGWLRRQDLR